MLCMFMTAASAQLADMLNKRCKFRDRKFAGGLHVEAFSGAALTRGGSGLRGRYGYKFRWLACGGEASDAFCRGPGASPETSKRLTFC